MFRMTGSLLTQCHTVFGFSFWTNSGRRPKSECSSSISNEWKYKWQQGAHPRTWLQTPAQIEQHLLHKSYNNSTQQIVMSCGKCPSFMAGQSEILPFLLFSPASQLHCRIIYRKLQPASSDTLHAANLWHWFKQRGSRGEVISLPVTQSCSVQLWNFLEILCAGTIGKDCFVEKHYFDQDRLWNFNCGITTNFSKLEKNWQIPPFVLKN